MDEQKLVQVTVDPCGCIHEVTTDDGWVGGEEWMNRNFTVYRCDVCPVRGVMDEVDRYLRS